MNDSCRPRRALLALAFLLALLAPQAARADSLTLAWDTNPESGVIGYYVYVGTAPGVYSAPIDVGNTTSYTLASAVPGTTYYMTVAAYAAGPVVGQRAPEVSGATTSAPTLTNPGDRTSPKDVALTLSLLASTSTGTPTFNASGLPIGLSLNASTGVIAGTPSAAGVYTVAVTASDASGKTAIPSFMWTIVASNAAPTLSI
ncbi:MAG: putative Ig domain-containing protein, partial [Vicinamibacterales bacterium]